MRSQFFISFAVLAIASTANAAETEFLGLYMGGAKVGYASYAASPAKFRGLSVTKTVSITELSIGVLGSPTQVHISDTTYVDKSGRPIQMTFDQSSNGRAQHVVADFGKVTAKVKIDNTGTISYQNLRIPKGVSIVDDPMTGLVFKDTQVGKAKSVFVLDPTTIAFVKNTIVFKGKAITNVHGKDVRGEWVQIIDPRATTDVYCKANGDLIKVNAPLGIEMFPESKEIAMSKIAGDAKVDLAVGSKITPVGELRDPAHLKKLQLDLSVKNVGTLPSDEHQTATKTAKGWSVTVHPPQNQIPSGFSIADAAKDHRIWTKPDLNVPSNEPRFVKLAQSIVGKETDVAAAAKKIQDYVYQKMEPDASIAVLRDANEVLDSHRGVCRDYAILAATLLRAAGIPTRLATGLVSWDGDFYYHAWDLIFNGKTWVGIDSTTDDSQMSAAHVELAVGTVSEAFMSPVLQNAVVKVVASQ